jgi:hypothetical protein
LVSAGCITPLRDACVVISFIGNNGAFRMARRHKSINGWKTRIRAAPAREGRRAHNHL